MADIKLGRIYLCKSDAVRMFTSYEDFPCKVLRMVHRLIDTEPVYEVQFYNGCRVYLKPSELVPTKLKESFAHAYKEGVDD